MKQAGLDGYLTVLPAHLVAEAAHPDIAQFLGSTVYRPQGIVAASGKSSTRGLEGHLDSSKLDMPYGKSNIILLTPV